MSLEQILAKNLTALMAHMPDVETIDKLASRSGVGRGTVDRIKKGEVSTKIETVEKLASALGVEPVQLLAENFDAASAMATPGLPESMRLTIETARELRLITAYRLANERNRLALDNFIERMQADASKGARNEG